MNNYRHDTQQCPLPNSRYCWINAQNRVTKDVLIICEGNMNDEKRVEWLNIEQMKV